MKRMSRIELAIFALVWLAAIAGFAVYASGAEPAVKFTAAVDGSSIKVTPVLPAGAGAVWYKTSYSDGKFTGTLITAAGSVPAVWEVQFAIVIGTNPTPGPTPDPIPPDPIPPTPTVLWGIVIEETKERTPAQAAVILSPKTDAAFKAGGGKFLAIDPWNDDGSKRDVGSLAPYVSRSEELKIRPALFIVDPAGTVYSEGKLLDKPEDVEALVAKIKKQGAKP